MLQFLMVDVGGFVGFFSGGFCALMQQGLWWCLSTILKVIGIFIDLMNIAFYIFAGIEIEGNVFNIVDTTTGSSVNILDYFVFNEGLTKSYFSLVLIGLVLIVIFTIYKIIKQDYFDRAGPRSKGPIFRNVAISCIAFVLVIPIFYLVIHASSLLAVQVLTALGNSPDTYAGMQLFQLSWSDGGRAFQQVNSLLNNHDVNAVTGSMAFMHPHTLFALFARGDYVAKDADIYARLGDVFKVNGGKLDTWATSKDNLANIVVTTQTLPGGQVVDVYAYHAQFYWYIFLFAALGVFSSLFALVQAMIQRIFMLLGLFVVAPAPISQYVLDDGAKFQTWLRRTIAQGLRVVSVSMSFSIYLLVLGSIRNIDFYSAFENALGHAESYVPDQNIINAGGNLLSYTPEFEMITQFTDQSYGTADNLSEVFINALECPLAVIHGNLVCIRDQFAELVNTFLQCLLVFAAAGACKDLDQSLSDLISSELKGGAMNAGETGKSVAKFTDAAKGLAVSAVGATVGGAQKLVAGAAHVAGAGAGAAFGAIKGHYANRTDLAHVDLTDKDIDDQRRLEGKEQPRFDMEHTAAKPGTTPPGGNGGGGTPGPDTTGATAGEDEDKSLSTATDLSKNENTTGETDDESKKADNVDGESGQNNPEAETAKAAENDNGSSDTTKSEADDESKAAESVNGESKQSTPEADTSSSENDNAESEAAQPDSEENKAPKTLEERRAEVADRNEKADAIISNNREKERLRRRADIRLNHGRFVGMAMRAGDFFHRPAVAHTLSLGRRFASSVLHAGGRILSGTATGVAQLVCGKATVSQFKNARSHMLPKEHTTFAQSVHAGSALGRTYADNHYAERAAVLADEANEDYEKKAEELKNASQAEDNAETEFRDASENQREAMKARGAAYDQQAATNDRLKTAYNADNTINQSIDDYNASSDFEHKIYSNTSNEDIESRKAALKDVLKTGNKGDKGWPVDKDGKPKTKTQIEKDIKNLESIQTSRAAAADLSKLETLNGHDNLLSECGISSTATFEEAKEAINTKKASVDPNSDEGKKLQKLSSVFEECNADDQKFFNESTGVRKSSENLKAAVDDTAAKATAYEQACKATNKCNNDLTAAADRNKKSIKTYNTIRETADRNTTAAETRLKGYGNSNFMKRRRSDLEYRKSVMEERANNIKKNTLDKSEEIGKAAKENVDEAAKVRYEMPNAISVDEINEYSNTLKDSANKSIKTSNTRFAKFMDQLPPDEAKKYATADGYNVDKINKDLNDGRTILHRKYANNEEFKNEIDVYNTTQSTAKSQLRRAARMDASSDQIDQKIQINNDKISSNNKTIESLTNQNAEIDKVRNKNARKTGDISLSDAEKSLFAGVRKPEELDNKMTLEEFRAMATEAKKANTKKINRNKADNDALKNEIDDISGTIVDTFINDMKAKAKKAASGFAINANKEDKLTARGAELNSPKSNNANDNMDTQKPNSNVNNLNNTQGNLFGQQFATQSDTKASGLANKDQTLTEMAKTVKDNDATLGQIKEQGKQIKEEVKDVKKKVDDKNN